MVVGIYFFYEWPPSSSLFAKNARQFFAQWEKQTLQSMINVRLAYHIVLCALFSYKCGQSFEVNGIGSIG